MRALVFFPAQILQIMCLKKENHFYASNLWKFSENFNFQAAVLDLEKIILEFWIRGAMFRMPQRFDCCRCNIVL